MYQTKIQVAFYKANQSKAQWDDKIIAWWTKGKHSHVEVIIGDMMYSTSPRDGRVRKKYHTVDNNVWDYVTVDLPNLHNSMHFFNQVVGSKYDWMGIFGFILPFQDRTTRWFCSEFVANFLKVGGYKPLFPLEPSRISPNKLYEILKGN